MEQPHRIQTPMYQHQLTALCWMVLRENSNKLPPFWEVKNKRSQSSITYTNTLTNFTTGGKQWYSWLDMPPLTSGCSAESSRLEEK
jgi:hypothetical protein